MTSTIAPVTDVPALPTPKKSSAATYAAVHRHALGGQCAGTVRIDAMAFHYDSSQHPFSITREAVRRIDGPGVVDASGKKWHFRLQRKTDTDVERLLRAWLEHARVDALSADAR